MIGTVHELPGLPSVGDAVTTVLNAIGNGIWHFADSLLSAVFGLVDGAVTPTIVYTPDGPMGKIYPITLWLGLFLAVCFGFAAVGKVALSGGQGIFGLLKGLALYAFVTAAGLGVLDTMKSASDATARGILSAMLNVNSWSSLSSNSTFMGGSIKGLSGIALALVSLLLIIPFGVGFLFEIIIRTGAMEILAATYPILTAGLVHEKFARWYWTGLRWMLALIFMTPLIALSLGIGQSIAQGSSSASTTQALGTALVGGVVSNMSLLTPFALFKLFAFVDPNTMSGQSFRGALGGGSSAGGQSEASPAGGSASADGGGQDDADGAGSGGADGAGAMKSGGDSGSSQNGAGIMSAMSQLMGQGQGGAQDTNSAATQQGASSLDSVGAGHPGGGQPGSKSDSDEKDHSDSDSDTDADASTSNGPRGSDGNDGSNGQGGGHDPSPTNPGEVPGSDPTQDPLGGGSSTPTSAPGGFDDPSGGQGADGGGGQGGGKGGSGGSSPAGGQGPGGSGGAGAGGAGSEAAVAAV